MTGGDFVLSVCIPTYNNDEYLREVLDHALQIPDADVEFVVSDDGSEDDTEAVVRSFDDDRLRYFRNETNLGYEENLLTAIERSNGDYVVPLADEDKIVLDAVEWMLDRIRDPNREFTSIIGGFGHDKWPRETWQEAVPETRELAAGRESLLTFVEELPHPFAEHTWRRNYIGGFLVKRSAVDLDAAKGYYGSLYIHNVLLIQAMTAGRTVVTPRNICLKHYFEYEGEHRFWGELRWDDLEYRVKIQQYRVKLIDELLTDPVVADVYRRKETRFAAQLAAWAVLSSDFDLASVREAALDPEVRPLTDIWTSKRFKALLAFYLVALPLPFDALKRDISGGLIPQRTVTVWFHLFARVLPASVVRHLKQTYAN